MKASNFLPVAGILLLTFELSSCNYLHSGFTKQQLAGSWSANESDGSYELVLKQNGQATGMFHNKYIGKCVWAIGNSLAGAENIKNVRGNYLAVICHNSNRVYSYHIDALTNDQLTLNYVIWGRQFKFDRDGEF